MDSPSMSRHEQDKAEADDWEYEYDEHATETFYVTLDLTTHSPPNGRTRQSATKVPTAPKPPSEVDLRSPEPEEKTTPKKLSGSIIKHGNGTIQERLDFVGLNTSQPFIGLDDRMYRCEWESALGSDIIYTDPGSDGTSSSNILPRQAIGKDHVIAATPLRLVARPIKPTIPSKIAASAGAKRASTQNPASEVASALKPFAERAAASYAELFEPSQTPQPSLDSPNPMAEMTDDRPFLERLTSIRRAKGEMLSPESLTEASTQAPARPPVDPTPVSPPEPPTPLSTEMPTNKRKRTPDRPTAIPARSTITPNPSSPSMMERGSTARDPTTLRPIQASRTLSAHLRPSVTPLSRNTSPPPEPEVSMDPKGRRLVSFPPEHRPASGLGSQGGKVRLDVYRAQIEGLRQSAKSRSPSASMSSDASVLGVPPSTTASTPAIHKWPYTKGYISLPEGDRPAKGPGSRGGRVRKVALADGTTVLQQPYSNQSKKTIAARRSGQQSPLAPKALLQAGGASPSAHTAMSQNGAPAAPQAAFSGPTDEEARRHAQILHVAQLQTLQTMAGTHQDAEPPL